MLDFFISRWPEWIQNISTTLSTLGLIVSFLILIQTSSIKILFTRKARVPELLKELKLSSERIGKQLESWDENKNQIEIEFSKIRGNLANLSKKLEKADKKKITLFIALFQTRGKFFIKKKLDLDENTSWKIFTELSELLTYLVQLNKDLKWI